MRASRTAFTATACALIALAFAVPAAQARAHRRHAPRTETAIATWYGPGLYGNSTACGQTLMPGTVGIASRTLPCGTLVRVSYRGRRVTVPVIDRGPYSFATWDLTSGAAAALGIDETVKITTRIVGHVRNTPTLGESPAETAASSSGGVSAD
ncbi:MAG TPA: septal ring lytic transglycosylase RlpA family protein [Solirubrobacteraceae bacterium]|nr:septal ring lytic transglycosylase RlpA family protein [Solirubrobacteraceae bacterium]